MKISEIPTEELLKDLNECLADITLCKHALSLGVLEYSYGKTQDRLDENEINAARIRKELARRGVEA